LAISRRALAVETLQLAGPAILQGLLVTVVFFTDRLFLGQYSAAALGSMQISGPLLWSVFSVVGAFSVGTLAVIGRTIGGNNTVRAQQTLISVLALAIVVGALIGVVGWLTRPFLADMLGGGMETSAETRSLAIAYMGIVFPASIFALLGTMGFVSLQASGDTRSPMWISGVAGAANVFLTWILVYGNLGFPELGVEGAAIGTSAAFGVQSLLSLWVLSRPGKSLTLNLAERPSSEALRPVLTLSLPALGERLLYHSGFLVFIAMIGMLGDIAMTTNQSLMAIESVGFIAANGFGIAGGALVALKLGAKKNQEARICGWMAMGFGAVTLLSVSLILLLFPTQLIGMFSDDPLVLALGVPCLRVAAIAQPLMAISDAMAGALRGAGDTKNPMWIAAVGTILVRITGCWLFAIHFDMGLLGIWIGSTLDWAIRATLLTAIFAQGKWEKIQI